MRGIAIRVLYAIGLIALGWGIGHAQQPLPAFELVVDAPEGQTSISCVRGCRGLAWGGANGARHGRTAE